MSQPMNTPAQSEPKKNFKLNRREFLLAGLASGLVVACGGGTTAPVISKHNPQDAADIAQQSSWLHIGSDDSLTIVIPSTEMGQGAHTSLAMLVCEELDGQWDSVQVVTAGVDKTFANPAMRMQLTGGSSSITGFWEPMRHVGAAAREMLMQAAAEELSVERSQLTCKQGVITAADGRTLRYGEVAEAALKLPVPEPGSIELKTPDQFTMIGKGMPRIEGPAKVNGTAEFGIDVQVPGMRVATIAQAPVFGGSVESYNEPAALAVNGVEQVINLGDSVAVIASGYWQAKKGLAALNTKFTGGIEPNLNSSQISQRLKSALDQDDLEVPKAYADSEQLTLEYEVPYLAHATLEPMNCTAHVTADKCEVWVPSQSQTMSFNAAKAVTDLDDEQIIVHTTLLGGGFGRRGESDFITQAVKLSQQSGKPIKLIWSREEDTQHDFYRPATVAKMQMALGEDGQPVAWRTQIAGSSIFKRLFRQIAPGPLAWLPMTSVIGDPVASEGAKHIPYLASEFGDSEFKHHIVDAPVPVGFWRSVGHSHNAFFVESAIDELAVKAGQDPYQYRRQLLAEHPRLLGVLDKVADMSDWSNTPPGRARGIAVHESFGSYVAQVVELEVIGNKQVKLHKIWCAADCGIVVDPDTTHAQMEGGLIFGLVAAADGEITIENGRVVQSNFHDYQLLRMSHVPDIDVYVMPSTEAPGGAGEPGTPPIAPALTNALFAATGERVRQLPILKSGYRLAPIRV